MFPADWTLWIRNTNIALRSAGSSTKADRFHRPCHFQREPNPMCSGPDHDIASRRPAFGWRTPPLRNGMLSSQPPGWFRDTHYPLGLFLSCQPWFFRSIKSFKHRNTGGLGVHCCLGRSPRVSRPRYRLLKSQLSLANVKASYLDIVLQHLRGEIAGIAED